MKKSIGMLLLFASTLACGDVPSLIHYQGRLLLGTNLVSGAVGLSLRLYSAPSGGTLLYEDSNTVTVVDGLYATWIGDNTVAGSLGDALTNAQVWLEVGVNGTPLSPRERVAAVAYALIADGVRTGGITSAMIAAGAVQPVHLATGTFVRVSGDVMSGALTNQEHIAAPRFVNVMNNAAGYRSVALGGELNTIGPSANYAAIGGGRGNQALGFGSVVAGGFSNIASGISSFVGGGGNNGFWTYLPNMATGASSVVAGGLGNTAGGWASTVPGGCLNEAMGLSSLAAGYRGKALHEGAFVWADYRGSDFASTRSNQFCVRAGGGVWIDTGWNSPGILLNAADRALITRGFDPFTSGVHQTAGRWGLFMEPSALVLGMPALGGKTINMVKYNPDSTYTTLMTLDQSGNMTIAGTYSPPSDRNLKQDFENVNGAEVLAKIAELPIQTWRYAHEENGPRHIGPTAQDFHAAFGLGADDRHIATVDADGVALAAIQELARQNAALRAEVEALKRQVGSPGESRP